jgi:uncharacterized protein YndB with AHSA1/START domain
MNTTGILVTTTVNAPIATVWDAWTGAAHNLHWNFASEDWHCPNAEIDLKVGGTMAVTMASKDGDHSFIINSVIDTVILHQSIQYTMEDGRKVVVSFVSSPEGVKIYETFEIENQNPADMQRAGWQAILDNFKRYAEGL